MPPTADTLEPTRTGSAYPPDLAALLPRARELPEYENGLPSRNQLMKALRIGPDKAKALLDMLAAERQPQPAAVPEDDDQVPENEVPLAEDLVEEEAPEVEEVASPGTDSEHEPRRPLPVWPLILIGIPAFVSIWVGWVGLGGLTGFGPVRPLPGIVDHFTINSAITLPVGMEAYAAYALRAWLGGHRVPARARRFARWSALAALSLGAAGQVAYHVMVAAGVTAAPWWITTVVACLPVAMTALAAALAYLVREGR